MSTTNQEPMEDAQLLFDSLDVTGSGEVAPRQLRDTLRDYGICVHTDVRLSEVSKRLKACEHQPMSPSQFANVVEPGIDLIARCLRRQLVIPDWHSFEQEVKELFEEAKANEGGDVADYIPELARANKEWFGVSFCSVDGQRIDLGTVDERFSVQSSSKPISYLMALEESSEEHVHRFIGREPSGRNFNEMCLNADNIPHNPLVNSGAIMACSLIKPQEEQAARFRHVTETWEKATGHNGSISFSNTTYLSERATADRNFCLAYMMQEQKAFQQGCDKTKEPRYWSRHCLVKNLELYFQCCSLETTSVGHATVAGTLANGGVCPLTGERVWKARNVRNALCLMLSCGMYDYSGEWAYEIGLPAKSGVSGCLLVVVPNVGGFCIYSPALDALGNSVRGIDFCRRLVQRFSFHFYDMVNGMVSSTSLKRNPCEVTGLANQSDITRMCQLSAAGDATGVRTQISAGAVADAADYDGRTPLHLAASEGHVDVVRLLLSNKVNPAPVDRWGGTPLSDAMREGHEEVVKVLQKYTSVNRALSGSLLRRSLQPQDAGAKQVHGLGAHGTPLSVRVDVA